MISASRCTNHEARLAAAQCLECGKHFCRECVTEHEGRLTCAACLRKGRRVKTAGASWRRNFAVPIMAVAALLGSWMLFYGAGWWIESATTLPVAKTGSM